MACLPDYQTQYSVRIASLLLICSGAIYLQGDKVIRFYFAQTGKSRFMPNTKITKT